MFGRKSKNKEAPAPESAEPKPKGGFIKRLRARLNKGDSWLTYDLANLVPGGKIDDDLLEELETRLLSADVGVDATDRIMSALNSKVARKELADADALLNALSSPKIPQNFPASHQQMAFAHFSKIPLRKIFQSQNYS